MLSTSTISIALIVFGILIYVLSIFLFVTGLKEPVLEEDESSNENIILESEIDTENVKDDETETIVEEVYNEEPEESEEKDDDDVEDYINSSEDIVIPDVISEKPKKTSFFNFFKRNENKSVVNDELEHLKNLSQKEDDLDSDDDNEYIDDFPFEKNEELLFTKGVVNNDYEEEDVYDKEETKQQIAQIINQENLYLTSLKNESSTQILKTENIEDYINTQKENFNIETKVETIKDDLFKQDLETKLQNYNESSKAFNVDFKDIVSDENDKNKDEKLEQF